MTRKLQPLKKGDIIDLVCPGFRPSPKEFRGAIAGLKKLGFVPRWSKDIFGPDILASNSDSFRLKDLYRALSAKDSKAVWCLRGGYGSIRLLPGLSKLKRPKSAKLFIGLSDITSLHLFLNQKWGWPTMHASLAGRLAPGKTDSKLIEELFSVLGGELESVIYKKLRPLNSIARKNREWAAPITGGNLIVSQSTLGTSFEIDTRGKFLFFEDIDERGYKVDRVLEHFRQCGKLDSVRGVLFGDFTGGRESNGKSKVWPVIGRFATELEKLGIPCFRGIPCGHGPVQRAIPFATRAKITGGKNPFIEIETGVVAQTKQSPGRTGK